MNREGLLYTLAAAALTKLAVAPGTMPMGEPVAGAPRWVKYMKDIVAREGIFSPRVRYMAEAFKAGTPRLPARPIERLGQGGEQDVHYALGGRGRTVLKVEAPSAYSGSKLDTPVWQETKQVMTERPELFPKFHGERRAQGGQLKGKGITEWEDMTPRLMPNPQPEVTTALWRQRMGQTKGVSGLDVRGRNIVPTKAGPVNLDPILWKTRPGQQDSLAPHGLTITNPEHWSNFQTKLPLAPSRPPLPEVQPATPGVNRGNTLAAGKSPTTRGFTAPAQAQPSFQPPPRPPIPPLGGYARTAFPAAVAAGLASAAAYRMRPQPPTLDTASTGGSPTTP